MSIYTNVTEQNLVILRNLAEGQKNQRAQKIKKRILNKLMTLNYRDTFHISVKS